MSEGIGANLEELEGLPRLLGESAAAFHAKVAYLTLGAERSLSATLQTLRSTAEAGGGLAVAKKTPSRRSLERWSKRFEWVKAALEYDGGLVRLAVRKHRADYLADIEDHRRRYKKAGEELHLAVEAFLSKLGKRIEAVEVSTLDTSRFAQDLRSLALAITTAADLEAHCLGLERLIKGLELDEAG